MARARMPVAVIDDDPAVLKSVARLLKANGLDAVTYSSAGSFLADFDSLQPSCVVADLAMPELTGLDLQERLASARVGCPMVFITGHGDVRSTVQAMRGGAVDFLTKPFDRGELIDAVQRAMAQAQAVRELSNHRQALNERLESLTPREREVFDRVVEGLLNKQIAASLDIAEKTVKVHRARVMHKMGVRSVAQLARIAETLQSAKAH